MIDFYMHAGSKKPTLTIALSAGLQEILRAGRRRDLIDYPLERRASIKDIVESIGIPHTEIGDLRVDDRQVDFVFIPGPEQHVRVSEITPSFEVTRPSKLRPEPLPAVRFIVDVNVGRLASLLRLAGFDAAYEKELADADIADRALAEKRIVLTRDRALLKRSKITFGRLVRAVQPREQLVETLRFFGLTGPFRLFSRCMACNGVLAPVQKSAIVHRLEPKTKKYFNTFKNCPGCGRIYWHGSHCDAMAATLKHAGLSVG